MTELGGRWLHGLPENTLPLELCPEGGDLLVGTIGRQ